MGPNNSKEYKLREERGRGQQGVVYRAKKKKLSFAMKILFMRIDDMLPFHVEEYKKEIKILSELDHPNVIKYIENFADKDGKIHIVTELAE
jgi:serine/threonine protein kinase